MDAVARRFISGLARLEDRLLIILDTDKLFGQDEVDLVGPVIP
jgi:purine-binding chemotaxis protein CheW